MNHPEIMVVYRIENPESMHGMWYREDGTYDPFIKTLTEGRSADLPMDPDPRYGQQGRRWYSAGADLAQMNYWFSARDAYELQQAGYRLFKFEVTQFIVEEFQVIFTRESIVSREVIPLETLWDMSALKAEVAA